MEAKNNFGSGARPKVTRVKYRRIDPNGGDDHHFWIYFNSVAPALSYNYLLEGIGLLEDPCQPAGEDDMLYGIINIDASNIPSYNITVYWHLSTETDPVYYEPPPNPNVSVEETYDHLPVCS